MEKGGGHVAHVYCAVKQCYNDMFTNTSVGGNREAQEHVQHLDLKPNTAFPISYYCVLYDAVKHTKHVTNVYHRVGEVMPKPKNNPGVSFTKLVFLVT